MAIVNFGSVYPACVKEFTVDTLDNPTYLPENAFSDFLHLDRVTKTIHKESHFKSYNADELQGLVDYSIKNPRVFLTLAVTKLIRKMPILCSKCFADSDLPVRMADDKKTGWKKVYSMADPRNIPLRCFVEGDDEMQQWDLTDLDHFVSKQWMFCAIIFKDTSLKSEINHMRPLPYVNVAATAAAGGHFGKVFKLGLLSEHITYSFERYFPQVRQIPNRLHYHVLSWTRADSAIPRFRTILC